MQEEKTHWFDLVFIFGNGQNRQGEYNVDQCNESSMGLKEERRMELNKKSATVGVNYNKVWIVE